MSADTVKSDAHANVRTSALRKVRTVRSASAQPRSLLGLSFAANALVQFAIQAWLAYSFAAHVWHLPGPLPFAAPAALDAFVVNMMIVTYELRRSSLRTRAYAWAVLSLGILLQVGAAEGFALYEQWGWAARIASFAPALLLAASLHTLIIRRREVPASDGQGRDEQAEADAALRAADAAFNQAAAAAPAATQPPRPTPAAVPSRRRPAVATASKADADAVVEVRALVASGVSCRDAARKLGRSKRWAEGKTKDIRDSLTAQRDRHVREFHDGEIAGEGALSPKGGDPLASEMQSDVAPEPGHDTILKDA